MTPLVSCVLPTKDRAAFIPQAIACYQSQTYPAKELVIVDSGQDGTADLIPPDPSIRYVQVDQDYSTGEMRNICASHAQGEILCHFDSDDWSAPERVSDQVTRLGSEGVVTGYHAMLFYDARDEQCYLWQWPHSPIQYVLGTSLCYRRDWWMKHPFTAIRVGEDMRFFQQAQRHAYLQVSMASAGVLMVARVHDHQTSRKSLNRTVYRPLPIASLPKAFPCDLTTSQTSLTG